MTDGNIQNEVVKSIESAWDLNSAWFLNNLAKLLY